MRCGACAWQPRVAPRACGQHEHIARQEPEEPPRGHAAQLAPVHGLGGVVLRVALRMAEVGGAVLARVVERPRGDEDLAREELHPGVARVVVEVRARLVVGVHELQHHIEGLVAPVVVEAPHPVVALQPVGVNDQLMDSLLRLHGPVQDLLPVREALVLPLLHCPPARWRALRAGHPHLLRLAPARLRLHQPVQLAEHVALPT